jgi:four helix bundle protein
LYQLICEKVKEIPGKPYRLIDQILEATSSISSNIAEGYCRRSKKEYLYFLNIALGSSGEVYSRCYACYRGGQWSEKTFDEIDALHYGMEGELLRLIESLERKPVEEWEDSFIRENGIEYLYSEEEFNPNELINEEGLEE